MKTRSRGFLFGAGLLLPGLVGCAWTEYRAYTSAKADYEACLEDNVADPDRCGVLKDGANRRYEEYESVAKQRWRNTEEWDAP